jgi:hypothetical protein
MSYVAERLSELRGNLVQCISLEEIESQRPALRWGQLGDRVAEAFLAKVRLDGLIEKGHGDSGRSRNALVQLPGVVRVPSVEVPASLARRLVGHLNDQRAWRSLRWIEDGGLLVNQQEDFLHYVFGLGTVSEDSPCDVPDQPGIALEQKVQRFVVVFADPRDQGLVRKLFRYTSRILI